MFTGIVEELGKVKTIKNSNSSCRIEISAEKILSDIHLGDSIAVNGICLTVTDFTKGSFSADIMHESLKRSAISKVKQGDLLNLERAMALNGRFGGHIVSGHIDGVGKIIDIYRDDIAIWFEIKAGSNILKYVVEKGSIAIDGISLTVAELKKESFKVSCIPHTIKSTVLYTKTLGDEVNLENDLLGKYVERLLTYKDENTIESKIDEDFLKLHGF
ncbi:riboflavin synthase [Peptoniphilus catoniae]|uniref:riboflavin synthase n=1 Tax=Peptoniphilus catoniae TaxID=1660341 RepID=UPI0010FD664F|nr:riboflavin synthase [Peptoniphilus catoniae]